MMRYMATTSRTGLRTLAPWTAPFAVGAVIAGIAFIPSAAFGKSAGTLTPKSASELLAAVEATKVSAMSGTIVETARFGLPQLPDKGASSLSWQALVTGSHTARVWIDGPQKQRLALLGTLSEADVVHNGNQLWSYTSSTMAVTHQLLADAKKEGDGTTAVPLDTEHYVPQTAAAEALKAIDPTTIVSVESNALVAGRTAYELVLTPRDKQSTISKVAIFIDGATSVPLRVQVFGSASRPAFETGFTDISFSKPAASIFTFTPPAGSSVTEGSPFYSRQGLTESFGAGNGPPTTIRPAHGAKAALISKIPRIASGLTSHLSPKVIGHGWTTVVEVSGADLGSIGVLDSLGTHLADGSEVIHTALVNLLRTSNGRLFIGAVSPAYLQQVASKA